MILIQVNEFTESRIRTLVVIAISSNLKLAAAPGNVLCHTRETGLPKDSVANVSQVLTLDKRFLTERAGRLPVRVLQQVEDGVRLVVGL